MEYVSIGLRPICLNWFEAFWANPFGFKPFWENQKQSHESLLQYHTIVESRYSYHGIDFGLIQDSLAPMRVYAQSGQYHTIVESPYF